MRGSLIFKNHIVHSQPFCDNKDSQPKGIKRFEESLTAVYVYRFKTLPENF